MHTPYWIIKEDYKIDTGKQKNFKTHFMLTDMQFILQI